jgi:proton glutamate symport protein
MGRPVKKPSLTTWILIGLVAGVFFGTLFPGPAKQLGVLGAIFLRLIKSIIAPLLFASLVTGSIKTMGRIGGKALVYFELVTTIALFVGLGAVNLVQPGAGVALPREASAPTVTAPGLSEVLEHTFPTSIVDAMARGEVLQIVVFSLLFGMACATIGARARPVLDLCDSLSGIMFRFTDYVMWFAPIGVFGAIASTIGERGLGVLLSLGKLVATLWAAEAFFIVVVLGAVIAVARIPLRRFIKTAREPFLIAFSTASSEAALPKALENLQRFGVPKHIAAFVLPAGYSFNLDGSTLYLALTSVFVAQAAGIHLPLTTQILMMLTLMLTSKGVASVPRASLVVLAATVASFGLPKEGVLLIFGVDTLMDMARTSVNMLGNCLAAAVVARWEGVDLQAGAPLEESVVPG